MSVADNQVANVNAWSNLGFLESHATDSRKYDLDSFLLDALQHLKDSSVRKSRSTIGRELVDGRGALNAIGKVLEYAGQVA